MSLSLACVQCYNKPYGWAKLRPLEEDPTEENPSKSERVEENVLDEVTSLLKLIPGFEDCDENDGSEWLESDKNDHG